MIQIGLIPEHPYRTLIIGGSGSGITNVLLNLIKIKNGKILTNITCTSKIHPNQSINFLLMGEKK